MSKKALASVAERRVLAARNELKRVRGRATGGAISALLFAVVTLGASVALLLARFGTRPLRIGAAAALFAVVAAVVAVVVSAWRRWANARASVARVVGESDRELAGSIARAVTLSDRSESELVSATPESIEAVQLSDLHLARQLSRIPMDQVEHEATRRGGLFAAVALAVGGAALAVICIEPMRVIEGADVLLATSNVAPMRLIYLDDVDILATPPTYLQQAEKEIDEFGSTAIPRGSIVAVRGRQTQPGRSLVLTDGVTEVSFVPEGTNTVIARWQVNAGVQLHIAAKMGDVRILQKETLSLTPIPDQAPTVKLEDAPRKVALVQSPTVALRYEAVDDHGLTEIALVLRSGGKELRKTLSRPSPDTRITRGGEELSTKEAFFKDAFLPIEVRIEARDNDAVTGPKWGRSASILVLPPNVGEAEARRMRALKGIRDAFVDLAANRVERELTKTTDFVPIVQEEISAQRLAESGIEAALGQSYGNLSIKGRVRFVIAGQERRLDEALATFQKKPSSETYAELIKANEEATLAVDGAVRSVAYKDAVHVAKQLSVVAIDVADAAKASDKDTERESAIQHLDESIKVLESGSGSLIEIGDLGLDLGDLVRSGVGRIKRPRADSDFVHAEIAARDLAERLKKPDVSIGGGGRPGVESGGGGGGGGGAEDGEASDSDDQAEQSGNQIADLVKKHQDQISKVAEAMKNATTDAERDALKKLAKDQAEALREAVKDLPDRGPPGSAAEKAAEGRKHAEATAGALEQGDTDEAMRRGEQAVEALREATKRGVESAYDDDQALAKESTRAANRIEESIEAMKDAMERMKKKSAQRSKADLKDAAEDEKRIAERTEDVKKRGQKGESSMPRETLENLEQAQKAMREAQKALEEGDSKGGKEKLDEAQRLLESANSDHEDESKSKAPSQNDGEGKNMAQDTKVPDKNKPQAPEDFQKRVTEGLGRPGDPRLRDAIKRYAEGLLR